MGNMSNKGAKLLQLYNSSQANQIKRLTAYFPITARRYGQLNKGQKEDGDTAINQGKEGHTEHGPAERAASTAEEFRRVAEEKTRQGFASQTTKKAEDGFQEAIADDSNFESVKESFKELPGKGNFHK